MPETKKKLPMLGMEVDVADVPVKSATEFFNEYELDDGSIIKVKSVATSFLRVEGQYLPDGRPVYIVMTTPVVDVQSSPLTQTGGTGIATTDSRRTPHPKQHRAR